MKAPAALAFVILFGLLFPLEIRSLRPQTAQPPSALFPFRSPINGKVGYIDRAGKVVIPPIYSQNSSPKYYFDGSVHIAASLGASSFSAGLLRVEIDSAYGFIGERGELLIQPRFQTAGMFSEGLASVRIGQKFGYIDPTGKVVISPTFELASDFSEGLSAVQVKGKYGYLDAAGKIVIAARFDSADQFDEGLAPVRVGTKYGYINKKGELVIKAQFDKARPFSEGLAAVTVERKYGYIDRTGSWLIRPQYAEDEFNLDWNRPGDEGDRNRDFSEGLAPVKIGFRYGYINTKGEQVIKPRFSKARPFAEGLAAVLDDAWHGWRYIKKDGSAAISDTFDFAYSFKDGLALVETSLQQELTAIPSHGRAIPGVNPNAVRVVLSYAYINKRGMTVFKSSISLLRGPVTPGPTVESYEEPPLVPVTIDSDPRGAQIYLIPLLKWDEDQNLINDSNKLFEYLQSKPTCYEDKVYQDVYVIVLELAGKRVPVRKDLNQFQERTVLVKLK